MKSIDIIAGARRNFMKIAPIIRARKAHQEHVVKTLMLWLKSNAIATCWLSSLLIDWKKIGFIFWVRADHSLSI